LTEKSGKMACTDEDAVNLTVKWAGKEYPIDNLSMASTVIDLKAAIQVKTNVLPGRQKLLNLRFKGKAPSDDQILATLSLKNGAKIMMVGSVEQAIQDVNEIPTDLPTVINDFEEETVQKMAIEHREEYLAKVANRVANYEVKILNALRDGKKLLVLDIDYTLFDHRSPAETGAELMRPHLHDFLTSSYKVSIKKNKTENPSSPYPRALY
jgi:ubiquitin-like domain-containing CTD phosphatase 1